MAHEAQFVLTQTLMLLVHSASFSYPLNISIGAVPTTSSNQFLENWRPTFETYLNEKVGMQFMPAITFTLQVFNHSTIFDAVKRGHLDFVFANPAVYACLDAESSGQQIAFNH